MDEPLSNLDAKLRVSMRTSLQQLHFDRARRPRFADDGRRLLGIRPEALEDIRFADRGLPSIEVAVTVLEELGSDAHAFFSVEAEHVVIEDALSDEGDADASILAEERDRSLLTARVDARTKASVGQRVRPAVDPARLYFFSPDSGESLLNGPVAR